MDRTGPRPAVRTYIGLMAGVSQMPADLMHVQVGRIGPIA